MAATSVTRSYTALVASVLDKVRDQVEDQISTGNKLLYFYRKSGNWKGVSSGGDRYRVSLMYELGGPVGAASSVVSPVLRLGHRLRLSEYRARCQCSRQR